MAAFFASDLVLGCWTLKQCTIEKWKEVVPVTGEIMTTLLAMWCVFQVFYILYNAIRRLVDRALLPLKEQDLTAWQWLLYAASIGTMGYKEGYEAFYLKWAPLVVKRAFMLGSTAKYPVNFWNVVLAGPYAMGMFSATRNRMIVSWGVTIGVTTLVQIVKKMSYPYRNIVDAGVVCGLSGGCCALLWTFYQTWSTGVLPAVDPCYADATAFHSTHGEL